MEIFYPNPSTFKKISNLELKDNIFKNSLKLEAQRLLWSFPVQTQVSIPHVHFFTSSDKFRVTCGREGKWTKMIRIFLFLAKIIKQNENHKGIVDMNFSSCWNSDGPKQILSGRVDSQSPKDLSRWPRDHRGCEEKLRKYVLRSNSPKANSTFARVWVVCEKWNMFLRKFVLILVREGFR